MTKTILIISRNTKLRTALGQFLAKTGFDVFELHSAADSNSIPPDRIVSLVLLAPIAPLPSALSEAISISLLTNLAGVPWVMMHSEPEAQNKGSWFSWIQTPCGLESILSVVRLGLKAGS